MNPTALADLPHPPFGKTGWPWTSEVSPSQYAERTDWPRVSIVTPSFNQASYLEETIRSVLLQNYPNLQFVVIDGGSTDQSVEILKKYEPWLDYWVSEPDEGQSHAINKGLNRCNGTWRNWLNSDDYLLPKALFHIGKITLQPESKNIRLVVGYLENLLSDGSTQRVASLGVDRTSEELLVNHRICQPAMFYHKDCLLEVETTLHLVMDFCVWAHFLSQWSRDTIAEIDIPVAHFRIHTDSKTSTLLPKFEIEERKVLRTLVSSMGSSKKYCEALARESQSLRKFEAGDLDLQILERVITRRHLLGELRKALRGKTSVAGLFPLWRICFERLPSLTLAYTFKTITKRVLRIA